MPIEWSLEADNLVVCQVSGELGKAEHGQMLTEIGAMINKVGKIRILVKLVNFSGWERSAGWEDTSFTDNQDPYIKKFAIAGDEKWRDLVAAFTLQGLRPVPIEYFVDESAARQWLDSSD